MEKLLESAYGQIEVLRKELASLNIIKENINALVEQNSKLPVATKDYLDKSHTLLSGGLSTLSEQNKKLDNQVVRLSNIDLKGLFNEMQIKFMKQSKEDFKIELEKFGDKIRAFHVNISDLESEVNRLKETDFGGMFKLLQAEFMNTTKSDLEKEYQKLDQRAEVFNSHNNAFEYQINRLSAIDLEKSFRELGSTLSNIFNAIHNLNSEIFNLNKGISEIKKEVATNHNLIENNINKLSETNKLLKTEFKSMQEQRAASLLELNSKLSVNKTILIGGFMILLILIIVLKFI